MALFLKTKLEKRNLILKPEQKLDINIISQNLCSLISPEHICYRRCWSNWLRDFLFPIKSCEVWTAAEQTAHSSSLFGVTFRQVRHRSALQVRGQLRSVHPSRGSSQVLCGLQSLSSSFHRLLLLQLDLCGWTFTNNCRETQSIETHEAWSTVTSMTDDLGQYYVSNIAIIAVSCDIFRNINFPTAASSGFYFEKKMHREPPEQQS